MEQIYTPKQNYKVLVHTITYNQAKYITDTLDGVAMQQTNFPFVHYVIDDCSTDGEQEVIKSWLKEHCDMGKAECIDLELANVIIVPHQTNKNITYAVYFLKRNLYKEPKLKRTFVKPWREHSEYEALCEGDDYWTHPQKLQMQVEYMDAHHECSLSFHKNEILYPDGKKEIKQKHFKDNYNAEEILCYYPFHTSSVLCKTDVLQSEVYLNAPKVQIGDSRLFLSAASCGVNHGIEECMSCYRSGIGITASWQITEISRHLKKNVVPLADYFQLSDYKRVIIPRMLVLSSYGIGHGRLSVFFRDIKTCFSISPRYTLKGIITVIKDILKRMCRKVIIK